MLIIERRPGTGLWIGNDIRVEVRQIRGKHAKLAIQAPKTTPIVRDEALDTGVAAAFKPPVVDRRFLLVDDSDADVAMLRRGLAERGVTDLDIERTYTEGLAAINDVARLYDVLVVDVSLPDGSGLDIVRAVRASPRYRATPTVVMSGGDSDQAVRAAIDAGANAFVAKSGDGVTLREAAHRVAEFWGSGLVKPAHHAAASA